MVRKLFALMAAGLGMSALSAPAAASYDAPPPVESDYVMWLTQGGNAQRVATFEAELERRGLYGIVPTYQILRTALSWQGCKAQPFELPDRGMWEGAFRSLRTLRDDIIPALGKVEIVSGYRDERLNKCAGGASRSVHRQFGAFDGYAVSDLTRDQMIDRLCAWHGRKGAQLAAGLGIYRGKKFHIDVDLRGNRRWGSDYSGKSSPCNDRRVTVAAAGAPAP